MPDRRGRRLAWLAGAAAAAGVLMAGPARRTWVSAPARAAGGEPRPVARGAPPGGAAVVVEFSGAGVGAAPVVMHVREIGEPAADWVRREGADIRMGSRAAGSAGTGDQVTFAGREVSGDFDWRVRVVSVDRGHLWAGGGLMVRAGDDPSGAFAAILSTAGPAGAFFEHRPAAGGESVRSGSFPANHPHQWLRLRRAGNRVSAYAGIDGTAWVRVGEAEVDLPDTVAVGLSGQSGDPDRPITARFAGLDEVTVAAAAASPPALPFEPMGPSSRNTELVISEIMYHPRDALSTSSLEFVEIHNPGGIFEDLTGFRLEGDIAYTFPEGTLLEAGESLVVARIPAALEAAYGLGGVLGPYEGNLPNDQGTVRLLNELGGVMLEVEYRDRAPWTAAADGTGHSLVLRRPSYGEADPRAWGPSDRVDGSPAQPDAVSADPLDALCINEFLAHAEFPALDQLELFNAGEGPLDLDGLIISDDPEANRFVVPPGTTLPAGGYLVYHQNELGFALGETGGFLVLKTPDGTRVVDAVHYGGQEMGVATGRYPDGAPGLSRLQAPSFGAANPRPKVGPVVINELMAHPISGDDDDQFVELHNISDAACDLSGWSFTDGIAYTFPDGAVLPAGGYLVVARNRDRMLGRYPGLSPELVWGDFDGRLSHRGERVALAMPGEILNPAGAVAETFGIEVHEVSYALGGRWGIWADGGGSSLELVDPRADARLAPNWADSDETAKAPWTLVEVTNVLDNGMSGQTPNRFEMLLQGAGECLVDEVECRNEGGANLVPNPGFDSSASGWVGQGTHRRTARTAADAYAGAGALHVVASGRGDTGVNRVRAALSGSLATGVNGLLRTRARWLKGNPYLLLRVRGNWIEAPGVLTVPADLGTPGAANSRQLDNAPPAVVEVAHAPVEPAGNEPVRVTARVDDPDGIAQVTMTYRLDPDTSHTVLAMTDDGAGGDARAGDGIYTAEIPGQPEGTLVAFTIWAKDAAGAAARFPDHAPDAEGLIGFGRETRPGSLGSYRVWLTQSAIDTWTNREKNSNDPLPCTFTYGQSRVIYHAGILYSGSPFHTPHYTGPLGFPCDYEMEFPGDDLFLGADDFVLLVQNPRISHFFLPDSTAQAEATAYWIGRKLGQPYMHRRWVTVHLNGRLRPLVFEDSQQPNADLLEVYFPDDPGARLHKIEDWFEFDDNGDGFNKQTATLENHTTTGGEKDLARYRWNWRPRAGTEPNDFSSLFAVVDAVGAPSPEPYTSRTKALIDLPNWLAPIAVHRIAGDWDSYGYQRGKNMFAYKPARGGWRLLLWDIDFALGAQSGHGPTTDLFTTSGGSESTPDPLMIRMLNHPPFRRLFLSILQDAAEGPLAPGVADRMLDDRYQWLKDNGTAVTDPVTIKNYMATRRAYILSQLPAATFSVEPPPATISGNLLTLTGQAPIAVRRILVNGTAWPVTWTTVTGWSVTVPLAPGSQRVEVRALDRAGALLARTVHTLTCTAAAADPADWVVINEIMHHPAELGGDYVEIYNAHPTAAFDLGDWRVDGVGYQFPPGAWIGPGGFQVLAGNRFAYAKAYGALTALAGEYDGAVDPDGQILTLYGPGTATVVNRVRYEAFSPWPAGASQPGSSLQLVDAAQDNRRVGNWAVAEGSVVAVPVWKQATATGVAGSAWRRQFSITLSGVGDVYVDDVSLVSGTAPGVGNNLLSNGGFESSFSGNWSTGGDGEASRSTQQRHSGQYSLRLVSRGGEVSVSQSLWFSVNQGQTYSLSFWYREASSAGPLTASLSASSVSASVGLEPSSEGSLRAATPARANAVVGTREPYPPVWLNEVQPEHAGGPVNGAGEPAPWLELYNAGGSAQSLDGYYLALATNNLLDRAFAAGASLDAGEFRIVFCDGRTDLASPTEWHSALALPAATGLVLLTRNGADGPEVVDYLNYAMVPTESSYGDVPDGQPFWRQIMDHATAGTPNRGAVGPRDVIIAEWMADNSGAGGLLDPADGDSDDWFELHNPGTAEADLGGYFLTDDLDTPFKYLIPPGYVIPPGGHLLVWADGEPEQNHPAVPHLHAGFQLSAGGEAIGLFAPDGTAIDTVVFGAQAEDVSQGRFPLPDGPVTNLAPTPGGNNFLTLPDTRPAIGEMRMIPGPTLVLDYRAVPGGAYRLEAATDPLDSAPAVLGLDRMAFAEELTETVVLPAPPAPRRIYFIRRVR